MDLVRILLRRCLILGVLVSTFGWGFPQDDFPPRFSTRRDLVLIPTTVTDIHNRYVKGLEPQHFRIFEDRIEQKIEYFANKTAPISVGFILDMSGSVKDNISALRQSIIRFLEQGNPEDEYFLVGFNSRTYLLQDYTPRGENVASELAFNQPKGSTSLYDAVYLGLEKLQDASNDKRALIVVSDGEENSSRYSFSEIKDLAIESSALIYAIGVPGEKGYGGSLLAKLTELTGGRPFFLRSLLKLDYFADLIHAELRSQYLLGFTSNLSPNGQVREIKVRLAAPEDLPQLRVRSRTAYRSAKR